LIRDRRVTRRMSRIHAGNGRITGGKRYPGRRPI